MGGDCYTSLGFSPAVVATEHDGDRLDRALSVCMPGTGLRARRRLWESCDVLVDGTARNMGFRVRTGQALDIRPLPDGGPDGVEDGRLLRQVSVVAQSDDVAAVFKPGGLHSVGLAGKPGAAAEDCLASLFPGYDARLVNRLDNPTSGLLVVALTDAAQHRFRQYEDAGRAEKTYLAVVRGEPESTVLDNRLETAKRRKTRVLDEADPDPVRRTDVTPIGPGPMPGTTLVRAVIHKGARHQIRAHLAHAGFPIVGDALYGNEGKARQVRLYLHHAHFRMPGFAAECAPEWGDRIESG